MTRMPVTRRITGPSKLKRPLQRGHSTGAPAVTITRRIRSDSISENDASVSLPLLTGG